MDHSICIWWRLEKNLCSQFARRYKPRGSSQGNRLQKMKYALPFKFYYYYFVFYLCHIKLLRFV